MGLLFNLITAVDCESLLIDGHRNRVADVVGTLDVELREDRGRLRLAHVDHSEDL